jgi:hypothetical protein
LAQPAFPRTITVAPGMPSDGKGRYAVPLFRVFGIHGKDADFSRRPPLPDAAYNNVHGDVISEIAASRMVQQRNFVV